MMEKSMLFFEIEGHLLKDQKPGQYLRGLLKDEDFQSPPFDILSRLINVPQSPVHHPEGNVWNHTILVVDEAAAARERASDTRAFMWAALLHDVGKAVTTKERRGKITAYDHDRAGKEMTASFLREFSPDEGFVKKVSLLVFYHMHMLYVLRDLPFGNLSRLVRDTNAEDVALLGFCDRMGRGGADRETEEKKFREFLKRCEKEEGKGFG